MAMAASARATALVGFAGVRPGANDSRASGSVSALAGGPKIKN